MRKDSTRIVSLIPSATEILAVLGLGDVIVGRSHECDFPPEISNLPVCTQARLNSNSTSSEIDRQVNDLLQSALSIYQIKIDIRRIVNTKKKQGLIAPPQSIEL